MANVMAVILAVILIIAALPFALESVGILTGATARPADPIRAQAPATVAPFVAPPQIVVRPITTQVDAAPVAPASAAQPAAAPIAPVEPAAVPGPAQAAPVTTIIEVIHRTGDDPLPAPPTAPNVERLIVTERTGGGGAIVTGSAACRVGGNVARRCAP